MLYLAHKYLLQAAAVASTTASAAGEGGACAQVPPPLAGESGPTPPQSSSPTQHHLRGDGSGGAAVTKTVNIALEKGVADGVQGQPRPATDTPAGAAFRAALLSNANLCGDSCNRGMLLGALMGAAVGARNIPADLVGGLYRADALGAVIDALADGVARSLQGAATGGGAPRQQALHPRFGRPRPLPLLRYVAVATPAGGEPTAGVGAYAAPRDFRGKLAAVATDVGRAGVPNGSRLRYVRGVGAVVLPPPLQPGAAASLAAAPAEHVDALLARVLPPVSTGDDLSSVADASPPAIDAGDAAADRAAALAALAGGGNGSGGTAAPAAGAAEPSSASAPAAPRTSIRLAELDPALVDGDSATNTLLGAVAAAAGGGGSSDDVASSQAASAAQRPLRVDCAPGTGVFYHRHPTEAGRRK